MDVDDSEKENICDQPKKKKKNAEDEEKKQRKARFDALVTEFNQTKETPNTKFGEYVASSLDSLKHDYNREILKQKIKVAISTVTYQESIAELGAMEQQIPPQFAQPQSDPSQLHLDSQPSTSQHNQQEQSTSYAGTSLSQSNIISQAFESINY